MKTIILMAALAAFTLSADAADLRPNGQPKECSVEQGIKATAFIAKHKKPAPVTLQSHEAHDFVWAITQINPDLEPFHDIERIVVIEANPEEHIFLAFMFGADKGGKPCVYGAIPLPLNGLNAIIEKGAENKAGI